MRLCGLLIVMLLTPRVFAGEPALSEMLDSLLASDLTTEERADRIDALFERSEASGDELARARLIAAGAFVESASLDSAEENYRAADLVAETDSLRAVARFNLGQTRFLMARGAMQPDGDTSPDFEAAKTHLRRSAEAFRAVLDITPDDAEAARNVERIRRMISRIEQMHRRAREQAEKMRQQADQLDELADRQEQESQQNSPQSQDGEQARRDQSALSREARQLSEKMHQSADQAQRRLQEAIEQQRQAAEQLDRGEQQQAAGSQQQAADSLRQAARALREQADRQEGSQAQTQDGEQGGQGEEEHQQGQPAEQEEKSRDDRLTEWLLDREQRQREQRDQQLRAIMGRPAPVEKDW